MRINLSQLAILLASLLLSVSCSPDLDSPSAAFAEKKGSYQIRTRHLNESGDPIFTNRLIHQDSLYLLQHAHNPVDWWSWGEAAFARARELDKPILLSIGYSTCHWCHVMERESFEDLEIAEYINQNFIAIKVDREERPDIDEVYLTAVQMLSGKAGWPLTAVLTPDALPFFGGTYFPPDQFLGLLTKISDTWVQRRDAVMGQAERLKGAISKVNQSAGSAKAINDEVIAEAQQRIQKSFSVGQRINDSTFPREPEMLFLLHRAIARLDEQPLEIVRQRLQAIADGGIHDQLGGGFHRYTLDANWRIPHFEKMLYNQAQLGQLYSTMYLLNGNAAMRNVAVSTFDFILREMQSPDGGFYSAIDAESDEREGAFYIWTNDDLRALLSDSEMALARTLYGVSAQGNFNGSNVLYKPSAQPGGAGEPSGLDVELGALQQKLAQARSQRTTPHTDTKIISAWNGMTISALLTGYQATGRQQYLQAATAAADVIWQRAYSKREGLARTVPIGGNRAEGTLEDYAYFARALLDLYDLDGNMSWLERAESLVVQMIENFHDEETGGFLISSSQDQSKKLFVSLVTARDDAINSGNSIAAQTLARLFRRTGNVDYRRSAQQVLAAFSKQLLANPETLSGMLVAADILNHGETGPTQYGANSKIQVQANIVDEQLVTNIDIAPGWHINSYRVLESELIPTALSSLDSHCPSIARSDYPQDEQVSLGFQEDELLVYTNQAAIHSDIDSSKNPTCLLISAELRLQACSDEVCLSPETMQIRVSAVATPPPSTE